MDGECGGSLWRERRAEGKRKNASLGLDPPRPFGERVPEGRVRGLASTRKKSAGL